MRGFARTDKGGNASFRTLNAVAALAADRTRRRSAIKTSIDYQQIRGAPPLQQDALLVGGRVHQEDELVGREAADPPFIVGIADGVAATPKAERMSRRLLGEVERSYRQGDGAFNARLIRRAQWEVSRDASKGRLRRESACTVVLAKVEDGRVTVLNTGDSRAYVIDGVTGGLRRLSKDHTAFQMLKDSGDLPPEAQDCDYGSVATGLMEAVTATPMGDEDFKVHMDYTALGETQIVLLCSDGVTAHLRDEEIAAEVVAARAAGEDACARLVERVRERGASDNTTVIVITPEERGSPEKE
jgi:protein phosphatase